MFLAAKRLEIPCTREQISAKIRARTKEFYNCVHVCESNVVICDTLRRVKIGPDPV